VVTLSLRAVESSKLVDLEKTEKSVFFCLGEVRTFFGVLSTCSILIHATGTSQTLNRDRFKSQNASRNHNGGLAFGRGTCIHKICQDLQKHSSSSHLIFVLSRLCCSSDFKVRLV